MKLTNGELHNLAQAIVMAGRDMGKEGNPPRNLPWRMSYALVRTTLALEPHIKAVEEARKAIIAKHADGAESVPQGHKNHAAAVKDWAELDAIEVEVTVHKFKLADIEGTSMSPVVLTALFPLIED